MSVLDCPSRSSRGWALCPDCGDELLPGDDHGDCDLTALKSLRLALSQGVQMTETVKCPRCESTDIESLAIESPHGDADQTICNDCEHRWGDGFPDAAGRPLPDGFRDCPDCEGTGDARGYGCGSCKGHGVVQTALIG